MDKAWKAMVKLYPKAGISILLRLVSFQHSWVKRGDAAAGTCTCSSEKRKGILFTAAPPPVQSLYTPTSYTCLCRQAGIRSYILPLPCSMNFKRQVKLYSYSHKDLLF